MKEEENEEEEEEGEGSDKKDKDAMDVEKKEGEGEKKEGEKEEETKVQEPYGVAAGLDENGIPVCFKDLKDDTEDIDDLQDSEHFQDRLSFLNLCTGNHYQFDQLRRAKHSSVMVLYHLHNPDAPKFVPSCAYATRRSSRATATIVLRARWIFVTRVIPHTALASIHSIHCAPSP